MLHPDVVSTSLLCRVVICAGSNVIWRGGGGGGGGGRSSGLFSSEGMLGRVEGGGGPMGTGGEDCEGAEACELGWSTT